MKILTLVISLLVLLTACNGFLTKKSDPSPLFEWNFMNFTFPDAQSYADFMQKGAYANCMLAGVKISSTGRTFVTVPRWKPFVPATLSEVVVVDGVPLLKPYPSWQMNQIGNPKALQSVLGFEIDAQNRMWVIDQGKVNNNPAIPGSIKLLVIDLDTDTLIRFHVFTEEEASLKYSFLNDIVIDWQNDFAYISDSGIGVDGKTPLHGGLIVYDFQKDISRRILSQTPPVQPNETLWIEIQGEKVLQSGAIMTGADGIALTPDCAHLIFCPLTSHQAYAIPTAYLRNYSLSDGELLSHVSHLMDKEVASDGLAFSNERISGSTGEPLGYSLYISSLEGSGVRKASVFPLDTTNTSALRVGNVTEVISNPKTMVWPDTFGFDHKGSLVFTSNQLHRFMQDQLHFNQTNFRIWPVFIGAGSYLDH